MQRLLIYKADLLFRARVNNHSFVPPRVKYKQRFIKFNFVFPGGEGTQTNRQYVLYKKERKDEIENVFSSYEQHLEHNTYVSIQYFYYRVTQAYKLRYERKLKEKSKRGLLM